MHIRLATAILTLLTMVLLIPLLKAQGTSDAELAARVLEAINTARVEQGLAPYALNPLLTQSAQEHSQYQRDTGQVTHTGADGSNAVDRVLATGYPAVRAAENIYAGRTGPEDAVHWWLTNDDLHRSMVLHADMREVGIGAATNAEGTTYYTMDISAQPNVLPIFIDNDAASTRSTIVMITLTNETVFWSAPGQIGLAAQVMISESPDFVNATVRPWEQHIEWRLDPSGGTGIRTIYVRYIDTAGRTADSQDSILYDPNGPRTPPPSPTLTASPTITPIPSLTLTRLPTILPVLTETALSTPGAANTPDAASTSDLAVSPTPSPVIVPSPFATQPMGPTPAPPGIPADILRLVFTGLMMLGFLAIVMGILAIRRR